MPTKPLTAGVVGAGIAGLSAAIALRRAGLEVHVYERSQFKNEIGAAISAPPNATAALRRWGFDFVAAKTVPNLCTRYAPAEDLLTVSELKYEDIEAVMGAPCLSFHRVDLHSGLRALATEDEGRDERGAKGEAKGIPVKIHLGCEVQSVDCENGVLVLANGTQVRKDLVIIADGAHVSRSAQLVVKVIYIDMVPEQTSNRLSWPSSAGPAHRPLDLPLASLHGRCHGEPRARGTIP